MVWVGIDSATKGGTAGLNKQCLTPVGMWSGLLRREEEKGY